MFDEIIKKGLNKESLREEFSKDYKNYYFVKLFDDYKFKRQHCGKCGKYFWSITSRDLCGDHEEYSFFKDQINDANYVNLWSKVSKFFKDNGHTVMQRYPVVSRWRQDLYFNIASIVDFQRIENGAMSFEYPANPLIVPQMCLRFNDIENVGVTSRHFTCFMMLGQHSFNWPKDGYWRDKTMELNFKLLTEVIGVKKEDIVYHEDVWAMGDFSEFGPSLESFANGLELTNNVFTQFQYSNNDIKELEGMVVDVGIGFERLLWFLKGYDSSYRSVFDGVIKKLENKIHIDLDNKSFYEFSKMTSMIDLTEGNSAREKEMQIVKKLGISDNEFAEINRIKAFYAILDHTRTLLFAISDGALPSNMGGGYNLRILLRRAFDFIDRYEFGFTLEEAAQLMAEELEPMFPELKASQGIFSKVISIERERYVKSREVAKKVLSSALGKAKTLMPKDLRTMYESYGITPEMIEDYVGSNKLSIELPANLYENMIIGDFKEKEKTNKIPINLPQLPKTEQLYYDFALESQSKVLFVKDKYVVLDKTPFYPEGGGQLADLGTISGIEVADVQKAGDIAVHVMSESVSTLPEFAIGSVVECKVDRERRERLMVHHSSTHLINACSREILGKHVWQEGTLKDFDKARIDITHYEKLSNDEVKSIENLANTYVSNGIIIEVNYIDRSDAEAKYGFGIYQGHGVPSKVLRIVTIKTKDGKLVDAEACGGIHLVDRENKIGIIKVIGSSRVHDGVNRLEFCAGRAALDYFQKEDEELSKVAVTLNVEKFESSNAVSKGRNDYSELYKKLEMYKDAISDKIAPSFGNSDSIDLDMGRAPREMMRALAEGIIKTNGKSVVILHNVFNDALCMCGTESGKSAVETIRGKYQAKFKGGGSAKIAEGKLEK